MLLTLKPSSDVNSRGFASITGVGFESKQTIRSGDVDEIEDILLEATTTQSHTVFEELGADTTVYTDP